MKLNVQVILVDDGSVIEPDLPVGGGGGTGLAADAMRTGHQVCPGESTRF